MYVRFEAGVLYYKNAYILGCFGNNDNLISNYNQEVTRVQRMGKNSNQSLFP